MQLIWHGTASIAMICDAGKILFDPFIPYPHSPVPVTAADFDGIWDIFITHGHLDHIASLPILLARDPEKRVFCTAAPYHTLQAKGIPEDRLQLLEAGQIISVPGFRIQVLPGRHAVLPHVTPARIFHYLTSPARGNIPRLLRENHQCRENGETLFYHIETEGKTISLLGSLNLRDDVNYPTGADLLVLPYNGWEDNIPPAVRVIEKLRPKQVVLDHYDDTFPPLTPAIDLEPILQYQSTPIQPLRLRQPFTL